MEVLIVNSGIYGCLVLITVSLLFVVMQLRHDNSLIDIAYGPTFFIAALLSLVLTDTYRVLPVVIATALGIWALRLSLRIGKKNWNKPEDIRYANWRREWLQKGEVYFIFRSLLQINLLQGIIIVLVALPFIIALAYQTPLSLPFLFLGAAVFLLGLSIETLADWQLDTYLKKKKAGTETTPILTTGLFKYSRRPNYFGETLIWWGLAIMVLPLPFGYLALISPLLITYIVTKITGPMLEAIFLEKYGDTYRAYMQKTSYFFPLPPKR
jgi:steroid 5-alpha reductase family enzyme